MPSNSSQNPKRPSHQTVHQRLHPTVSGRHPTINEEPFQHKDLFETQRAQDLDTITTLRANHADLRRLLEDLSNRAQDRKAQDAKREATAQLRHSQTITTLDFNRRIFDVEMARLTKNLHSFRRLGIELISLKRTAESEITKENSRSVVRERLNEQRQNQIEENLRYT
jgi:hypothetical protein